VRTRFSVAAPTRTWRATSPSVLTTEPDEPTAQAIGRTCNSLASCRISAAGYRRCPPRVFRNGSLPSVQDVGHLGGMEVAGRVGDGLAAALGCHRASPFVRRTRMLCRARMDRVVVRPRRRKGASHDAVVTLLRAVRTGRSCGPTRSFGHSPIRSFLRTCYLAHGAAAKRPDPPEHGEAWATARPPRTRR
jgi:hypothetical protein